MMIMFNGWPDLDGNLSGRYGQQAPLSEWMQSQMQIEMCICFAISDHLPENKTKTLPSRLMVDGFWFGWLVRVNDSSTPSRRPRKCKSVCTRRFSSY